MSADQHWRGSTWRRLRLGRFLEQLLLGGDEAGPLASAAPASSASDHAQGAGHLRRVESPPAPTPAEAGPVVWISATPSAVTTGARRKWYVEGRHLGKSRHAMVKHPHPRAMSPDLRVTCPLADWRPSHRRRPHGALQLAVPANGAVRRSCGSRTATASAPPRRMLSRSSTRCSGSGSTGTKARSPRRKGRRATRRRSCEAARVGRGHRECRHSRGRPLQRGSPNGAAVVTVAEPTQEGGRRGAGCGFPRRARPWSRGI